MKILHSFGDCLFSVLCCFGRALLQPCVLSTVHTAWFGCPAIGERLYIPAATLSGSCSFLHLGWGLVHATNSSRRGPHTPVVWSVLVHTAWSVVSPRSMTDIPAASHASGRLLRVGLGKAGLPAVMATHQQYVAGVLCLGQYAVRVFATA